MVILHFKIPIAQFSSSGFFWPPFDLPINLLFVRSPFFFFSSGAMLVHSCVHACIGCLPTKQRTSAPLRDR